MNLITKEYISYKFQLKVQRIIFILIIISLLYIGYLGLTYTTNSIALENFTNLEGKISEKETEIKKIDDKILELEEDIKGLDKLLSSDNSSEESKKSFQSSEILYNILSSTNNSTKLHYVEVVNNNLKKEMTISGASLNIDDISSLVDELSQYYNVDVSKTQQIKHMTSGIYYGFTIVLSEKGV